MASDQFKSPIFKKNSLNSRSSILSIKSSGEKSNYRNSATREKYLRNSRNRLRRKTPKSSKSESRDSRFAVNQSSVLICAPQDTPKSRHTGRLDHAGDDPLEVSSVLIGSKTRSPSMSKMGPQVDGQRLLESLGNTGERESSLKSGRAVDKEDSHRQEERSSSSRKKESVLRGSERGREDARNMMSEALSCLSSKKQSQSILQSQKREIVKLNEKVRQYEKIVMSKNIIIDELEKELNG